MNKIMLTVFSVILLAACSGESENMKACINEMKGMGHSSSDAKKICKGMERVLSN